MGYIRPATPGFIVTLVAAILLAIVSFCVPYLKSIFFLRASITQGGVNGSVIFGTLGYCLELSNGTVCSKPAVGYELDINALVGNNLPIKIPQVVVKWITTALVLHIAALIVTAVSALFGLLAHVREMSMTYFSTCISGFAALIALVAFIFDLILFGVAKTRIKSVGSAQIGSAVWLTFAAWVLLFFSGCFYSCGRNCISNRPSKKDYDDNRRRSAGSNQNAIKAEEAFRKPPETGLPSFSKTEIETRPLTGFIDGNEVRVDDDEVRVDDDEVRVRGYAPLQSENRAVNALGTYPPGPQSQHTLPGAYMRAASGPQLLTTQHTPPYYSVPHPNIAPNPYPPPTPPRQQYHPQYNFPGEIENPPLIPLAPIPTLPQQNYQGDYPLNPYSPNPQQYYALNPYPPSTSPQQSYPNYPYPPQTQSYQADQADPNHASNSYPPSTTPQQSHQADLSPDQFTHALNQPAPNPYLRPAQDESPPNYQISPNTVPMYNKGH